MSNWEPKTVLMKIKEKILWPFSNDKEKIVFFTLIIMLIFVLGLFNIFSGQKKARAQISISSWSDLSNIDSNLSGNYILTVSLDKNSPGYETFASSSANGGEGWLPIGDNLNPFVGSFDGQGYKIKDLYINRPIEDYIGLFGYIDTGASITSIGLENIDIVGKDYIGGLVGYNNNGEISFSYTTGEISGTNYIGGLVGASYSANAEIINSYSRTNTNGTDYIGGLIGFNQGLVNYAYSTGEISGTNYTGGLIGENDCPPSYGCPNILNSFYDTETSLQVDDLGKGKPKTTLEMKNERTFTDVVWSDGLDNPWDFLNNPYDDLSNNDYWDIDISINNGYPLLVYFNISIPSVTTNALNDIGTTTAILIGEITDVDKENASIRGFKYYMSNDCSGIENDVNEIGNFNIGSYSLLITGLASSTTYSYKSYATNSAGTGEGNCLSFETLSVISIPSINTLNPTNIGIDSVVLNGEIINKGGENSSIRGFKYYMSDDCSGIENDVSEIGSFGNGNYSLNLINLYSNTTYSYKSYATNSAGTGEGNCIFFLTSSNTVPINYYNVFIDSYPTNGGEVFGQGSYAEGSFITVSANPNQGYKFISWKENNIEISNNSSYSFTLNSSRNLTANFEKEKYLIINLPEGFSVYNSENGEDLTKIPQSGELIAILKKGEILISRIRVNFNKNLDWSELRADSGYYSFNNRNYGKALVHFEDKDKSGVIDFIILIPSIRNTENVYICPSVQEIEDINENCEGLYYLNLKSKDGFYEVNTSNTGGAENYEIFEYNVSISLNIENSGTVDGAKKYKENENVTVTALPKENYRFLNWTENNILLSNNLNYSFVINSDRNLVANFEIVNPELVMGCTDIDALNYNSNANTDDGSCEYGNNNDDDDDDDNNEPTILPLNPTELVMGCTDTNALNYNMEANTDDGSCIYDNNFKEESFYSGIEEIFQETKEFVNSPIGNATTKMISTTGAVIGTGSLIASAIFINPFSFSNLFLTLFRLWSLFLVFLGFKKRHKPWGTVYDSITKQPLDPAYVFLQDEKGEVIADSITDLDGRYGFLVKPGSYKIVANKTNYVFPSVKLKDKKEDGVYDTLYFGETIEIKEEGEIITKNIPMDPLNFDWNEFAKRESKKMKFYSDIDRIFSSRIVDIFFIFGFFIAIIASISAPYPYNIIVLTLYILLMISRSLGFKPRKGGYVREKETKNPLSSAIIKVFLPEIEKETLKKVASNTGKYFCLVPPGIYYVKIEKKNLDGSYSHVYTSKKINAKKGIIKEYFEV